MVFCSPEGPDQKNAIPLPLTPHLIHSGVAGVVHSCTVANEQGVNDNNITNMVELADHVQRHGDGDTQEHQEKAGHGLGDGDCG